MPEQGQRDARSSNQAQPIRRFFWLRCPFSRSLRPRVHFLLESHDEVVSITDDRNSTVRMSTMPFVNPEIENVVREDVGEKRADSRPRRRTLRRLVFLTALGGIPALHQIGRRIEETPTAPTWHTSISASAPGVTFRRRSLTIAKPKRTPLPGPWTDRDAPVCGNTA
jgi:hypothetical protein